MSDEQEIALQRIKDSEYISYEGNKEDIALLQSLMERVAKSEIGAKIIAGLKKNEELPEGHQLRLRMGEEGNAAGFHSDNGIIYIIKGNLDFNDEAVFTERALILRHELCHEEQFQQGIVESSNFTPEQNFIINRLKELDAGDLRREVEDIKAGFEGIGIPGGVAATSIYNRQALRHSIHCMQEDKRDSAKSFEEIRAIYVKRLGVDIEPEYFSAETLAKSPAGEEYFVDGKLPIQQESHDMSDGKLIVFKHPEHELRIYTPEKGNISIEEEISKNGYKTTEFFDEKSSETILSIEESELGISRIQKSSYKCSRDYDAIKLTLSQMKLPKDVIEAFPLDEEDLKIFTGKTNESNLDMLRRLSGRLSGKNTNKTQRKNTTQISSEQRNYTVSSSFNGIER